MAPEVRFTITEKLDKILNEIAESIGVDKSDYIRSLILNDLKNRNIKGKKK